jgi:hypothetical protein
VLVGGTQGTSLPASWSACQVGAVVVGWHMFMHAHGLLYSFITMCSESSVLTDFCEHLVQAIVPPQLAVHMQSSAKSMRADVTRNVAIRPGIQCVRKYQSQSQPTYLVFSLLVAGTHC